MSDSNGSFNGRSQCRNVTAAHPCPICGRSDWCSVSEDGDVCFCRRQGDPSQEQTDKNGDRYYLHRLRPASSPCEPRYSVADGGGQLADPDTRHLVYSSLLKCLTLFEQHANQLKARGLKDGLMAAGYRSLPERRRYRVVRRLIEAGLEEHLPTVPGFFVAERDGKYWTTGGKAGLLIPVRDIQQRITGLLVRPDEQTEGGKYRWLSSKKHGGPGPGAQVHVPLFKGDTSTMRVTEGVLKADVATRLSNMLTIGLPGVGSFARAAAVLTELGPKVVRVAFDADASRNRNVAEALYKLTRQLLRKGFEVELETWDEANGKGIDDLLAAGRQPTLIQGEKVLTVTQGIAELAGVFNRPGSSPPGTPCDPSDPDTCFLPALDIITKHFQEYYRPTFRRGASLYSEVHGRIITASEACFAATPQVIDDLEMASDAPRNEHGVTRSALPKFFKTWAPVAWRGVLDSLQEEEQTAEVVGSAAEEFRGRVAAGLHTHVVLGYRHQGTEETRVERRSLIAWASLFAQKARPGVWGQVRNYLLWCRRDDAKGALRVALRVGLFASGQAHLRSLAEMNQYSFAQLCELYGVGTAQRACGQRVVELDPEFIAELLATPMVEKPEQPPEQPPTQPPPEQPPCCGTGDGRPADAGRAIAMGEPGPSGSYLGGL